MASTDRTCAACKRWRDDPARSERWANQRCSRVEVLTAGAAEIVRQNFTRNAIRDGFEFKVSEPLQLEFGRWVEDKAYTGHVQTSTGRWVSLWERVDTFVPFTLAAVRVTDGRHRRNPFADVMARAERWWGGVAKVARMAGALAPAGRKSSRSRWV